MGFLNKLFGGGHEEGQGMAAQLLSQITSDLNLSPDQLEKMKSAFQQFRQERKSAKDAGGSNIKEQMHDVRQELKDRILGILNDEQKQKFMASIDKYKEFFQK